MYREVSWTICFLLPINWSTQLTQPLNSPKSSLCIHTRRFHHPFIHPFTRIGDITPDINPSTNTTIHQTCLSPSFYLLKNYTQSSREWVMSNTRRSVPILKEGHSCRFKRKSNLVITREKISRKPQTPQFMHLTPSDPSLDLKYAREYYISWRQQLFSLPYSSPPTLFRSTPDS